MDAIMMVCPNCEDEFFWPPSELPRATVECEVCYTTLPWDMYEPPQNYVTRADIIRHQRGQVLKAREFFDEQRRRKAG